jgi:hypothetical protein
MTLNIFDQIIDQRGSFQRLLARLPGFRGYIEKGERRQADMLLRAHIAEALNERVARMMRIESALVDGGGMKFMSKSGSARMALQRFRDQVKTAMPGYSGFDSAIKIDEEALERLYGFDEAQLLIIDKIDAALDAFEAAVKNQGDIDAALDGIVTVAGQASEAFQLRESTLSNLDLALS